MDASVITTVLDKVSTILWNVGAPVIVLTVWFAVLSLFLHFKK